MPVVNDLEAADTEALGDLCAAYQIVNIDLPAHGGLRRCHTLGIR